MENIDKLYTQHIKPLPPASRLRLLAHMALDLAGAHSGPDSNMRSLLDLEGLGVQSWRGVDAQAYVRALREEWGERL